MSKHGIIYKSIKNMIVKKQGTYLLYNKAEIKVEKDKITKQVPRCDTVSMLSTNCVGINPEMPIINLAYCMLHKKEIDERRIIPKQIIFTNDEEIQTFMNIVEKIENFYNKEHT